jgi:hypothetical protein
LQEPNLGKTNHRVSLFIRSRFVFAPYLSDSFLFLTLTRIVVVIKFVNFRFALFTPPLGDFHSRVDRRGSWRDRRRIGGDYVSKRTEAVRQSPIKLWSHLQARILP